MAAGGKRSIIIEVLGEFGRYVSGSKNAAKATGSFTDKIEAAGSAIALAYSAKRVIDFAAATVRAAVDDAKAQQLLAGALERNAGARADQIAAVEDWIQATQNELGILDDDLRPAYATMVRATHDVAEAQDLMTLSMDISRATGKDLETVSAALAKAYGGNTVALSRLVPGLKRAGEGALSFADAKARLNEMFAGSAQDYATTEAGKLERLSVQYEDMKERIGTALLPVLNILTGMISGLFDWFNGLNEQQQQFIVIVGLAAGGAYVAVSAFIALRTAVTQLGFSLGTVLPVIGLVGAAIGAVTWLLGDNTDETSDNAAEQQALGDAIQRATFALLANADAVAYLSGKMPAATAGAAALSAAVIDAMNVKEDGDGDALIKLLGEIGFTAGDAAALVSGHAKAMADNVDGLSLNMYAYAEALYGVDAATQDNITEVIEHGNTYDEFVQKVHTLRGETMEYTNAAWANREAIYRMTKNSYALADSLEAISDDMPSVDAMAQSFIDTARGASELTANTLAQAKANLAARGEAASAVAVYTEYLAVVQTLSTEEQRLALNLDAAAASTGDVVEEATDLDIILQSVTANQRAAAAAADVHSVSLQTTADRLGITEQAAKDLKAAIDAIFAPFMNLEEASRGWRDAADKLTESFQTNGATIDLNTAAGRANRAQIDDSVRSILDYTVAMVGAGHSQEEAADWAKQHTEQLSDQLQMLGLTEEQANDYLETLGLTPENIETTVALAEADRTRRELEDMLEQLGEIDDGAKANITAQIARGEFETARADIEALARDRDIVLHASVTGSGTVTLKPGGNGSWYMKAYARGGYPQGGEPVLVGERGPEIAQFPAGTRIRSASASRRMVGGASGGGGDTFVTVKVAGSVVTERQVTRSVARGVRAGNRRQGRDTLAGAITPIG